MTGTPPYFDEQGLFFTFMQEVPSRRIDCLESGDLEHNTVLVYDKGSDRALVCLEYHYADGPFVRATVECAQRMPGQEPPPLPFATLAEAGKLKEDRAAGSVKRQVIHEITDEKEISTMYKTLGDDAARYAWIHRSVLDAVLKERFASHGLRLVTSLFLTK